MKGGIAVAKAVGLCYNPIMQQCERRTAVGWLEIWLAVLCLWPVSIRGAQPRPLHHAETNARGIDYSHPEKYLTTGTQTTLTREDWQTVQQELQFAQVDLAALKELYAWKSAWFKSVRGGGKFIGRHTVQDLLRKRELTGCHDHGLIVVAVLRRCGVPAVFVDATGIEWALEYPDKTKSFRLQRVQLGHDPRVHFLKRSSARNRFVVCSRSRRPAATSSVKVSHASVSSFSSGSNSFSLKNTRHVAKAVRLLPSTNG